EREEGGERAKRLHAANATDLSAAGEGVDESTPSPYVDPMRHRHLLPLLLLVLLPACLPACQTRLGESSTLDEAVGVYLDSSGTKAFAIAADERGKRVWGSGRSLSQDRSNEIALDECAKNAKRLGVEAQCFLFAVGPREAKSTVDGCAARRINAKRCAVQENYAPMLAR